MQNSFAPFYQDVAQGPECVKTRWVKAEDGIRLRVSVWPEGDRGTVLLFPGRTEYVEKYGPAAAEFRARGLATASIDWRGQGLSNRPFPDRRKGHVSRFAEYQIDVAAMTEAVCDRDLPRPRYLLAHSMGGCIGLRSLIDGLDVRAAVFSAPMWGIAIQRPLRPVAWALAWAARTAKFEHWYTPGTGSRNYVQEVPFERNHLTTDKQMYAFMQNQIASHPDLALGGPSLQWLHEALSECHSLARMSSPKTPAVTLLGDDDHVIDTDRVHLRMDRWPSGRLVMIQGAKHEPMMESCHRRNMFYKEATEHLVAHS